MLEDSVQFAIAKSQNIEVVPEASFVIGSLVA